MRSHGTDQDLRRYVARQIDSDQFTNCRSHKLLSPGAGFFDGTRESIEVESSRLLRDSPRLTLALSVALLSTLYSYISDAAVSTTKHPFAHQWPCSAVTLLVPLLASLFDSQLITLFSPRRSLRSFSAQVRNINRQHTFAAMRFSVAAVGAALVAVTSARGYYNATIIYSTKVVTAYTTYCPTPTVIVNNNVTYVVTSVRSHPQDVVCNGVGQSTLPPTAIGRRKFFRIIRTFG